MSAPLFAPRRDQANQALMDGGAGIVSTSAAAATTFGAQRSECWVDASANGCLEGWS
ncbi:hypothetical protein [Nocardia sp. NPDC051463]|uniref:hypothetical protein n=1 Tax=Nocardia sp. NPDC051463 TaxID=3154845 RepID=UPI00344BF46A